MTRRHRRPLILTLAFLVLLTAALLAGGLRVPSLLGSAFSNAEEIRSARMGIGDALRAQVDEETGVRGYAVARDPVLLEPYYTGRNALQQLLPGIRSTSVRLAIDQAVPAVDDARAINREWLRQVAYPIIVRKKRGHVFLLHGKILVDRFRVDLTRIDTALKRRETLGDTSARRAIAWASVFALGAVFMVVFAATAFTIQQYRLGLRLERQLVDAELERRKSAEVRAAYEAEKRIADMLQGAFTQRTLPELPAVRLSATYVPAGEEAKVGGDWYDALALSRDRVLLAIGDVAGHGITAAVAMNKARQVLIACALVDATPGTVLERVNQELFANKAPMITAIAGLVDGRTSAFSYAAAGHPAPVLIEPGRPARFLDVGSLPLGVIGDATYATHRVKTVPGAMLVLYTDGVIEHSRDVLLGERLLLDAIDSTVQKPGPETAQAICDRIFARHCVADDVAIMTVHFLRPAAIGSSEPVALRRTA